MIAVGIETSCDETAIGLVKASGGDVEVLASVIKNNLELHSKFGGVLPKYAARDHLSFIRPAFDTALEQANIALEQVDCIAVTIGPGLVGSLLVGVTFAKALSLSINKPIIYVNHIEAHAMCPMLTNRDLTFPFMLLLVSGGHTELVLVNSFKDYLKIGKTRDDSVGEAFDKVGRSIGLGYPAGPEVEKYALRGEGIFNYPKNILPKSLDFSFSGIKSAVIRGLDPKGIDEDNIDQLRSQAYKANVCRSFQDAIIEILVKKTKNALGLYPVSNLVVSGGVAANKAIRAAMCKIDNVNVFFPESNMCTDNGVMIAYTGILDSSKGYNYNIKVNPRLGL